MSNVDEPVKVKVRKYFKGYINYYILTGPFANKLKTHHFSDLRKRAVTKLQEQFSNPLKYHFIGIKSTLQRKEKVRAH